MSSPSPRRRSRSPRRSHSPKTVSTSSLDRMIPTSIGPSTLEAAASILEKKARRSHSPSRRSRSPSRRSPSRRSRRAAVTPSVTPSMVRHPRSPNPRYYARHGLPLPSVTPSVTPSM